MEAIEEMDDVPLLLELYSAVKELTGK